MAKPNSAHDPGGPPVASRNLMYVVIAEATKHGRLGAMAESCRVPHDVLAWTAETAGATLANFALFDLVSKQMSRSARSPCTEPAPAFRLPRAVPAMRTPGRAGGGG